VPDVVKPIEDGQEAFTRYGEDVVYSLRDQGVGQNAPAHPRCNAGLSGLCQIHCVCHPEPATQDTGSNKFRHA
jgi:hypothetical protein